MAKTEFERSHPETATVQLRRFTRGILKTQADPRFAKAVVGFVDATYWIENNLGKDVPLHFSRFFPMYKMLNKQATLEETLLKLQKVAERYLNYVYVGNVRTKRGENTYCPKCKELLIERDGFRIIQNKIKKGRCECGEKIAGVWE